TGHRPAEARQGLRSIRSQPRDSCAQAAVAFGFERTAEATEARRTTLIRDGSLAGAPRLDARNSGRLVMPVGEPRLDARNSGPGDQGEPEWARPWDAATGDVPNHALSPRFSQPTRSGGADRQSSEAANRRRRTTVAVDVGSTIRSSGSCRTEVLR